MPKPIQPETFESQGKLYLQQEDKLALIKQIASEIPRETPSSATLIKFQDEQLILRYHCIDRDLDNSTRVMGLVQETEVHMREYLKTLKAEYKKRSGTVLSLKEEKERRNYAIQKVSLNGTFEFVYQQVFDFE